MKKHDKGFEERVVDEREWQAQERARLEARIGGTSDDALVARHVRVKQLERDLSSQGEVANSPDRTE